MRILIVEDDREVAGNIAKMLRESGHVVDMAHDGEDGLAMARDGAFDVLIVDRMMIVDWMIQGVWEKNFYFF